jgi:uncharacterized membrane protein
MHFIIGFFGRFHPLLVHLPIGFLFLAFLFECLSATTTYRPLRKAVQPALLWGMLFAIASAISGYFLRQEGGYEERLVNLHQTFGISTAALSLALYVVRPRLKSWVTDPVRRKKMRILLFLPLILLLSVTGHFGGSLTHGEDYLFEAVSLQGGQRPDPSVKIKAIVSIPDAQLYGDVIQPILESRCYDCHSSSKQKGELRLDKVELIAKGGKHGPVISAGPADSSAIFRRLTLPVEDKHHMPPEEKPQLSSSEIALIKYWVEGNAPFDQPVSRFVSADRIGAILKSMQANPRESWIPLEQVAAADAKSLDKVSTLGLTPLPMANGSDYLMITFAGIPDVTNAQINSLRGIKEQLVSLDLNSTNVTDEQMEGLAELQNLRVLYLNNTKVSDAGLKRLSRLSRLRVLSLVGTGVTDASIPVLTAFKKLTNLFLFQTGITKEGIGKLTGANGELKIDTGNYVLEPLATDTIVYKQTSVE